LEHGALKVADGLPLFRGGRFEVVGRLGTGGFGTVFEAIDHELERHVAIKALHGLDADSLLDFKREFRGLQDLRHPNVAELYALFEQDGQFCFSMELIEGCDPVSYVRGPSGCDFVKLRSCIVQLARALGAVHASGLVHRDVKPSNIRVTAEGRLVLLDFGLSVRSGTPAVPRGTPRYMAPEQTSERGVTSAADAYAMGSVIYEAITGTLTFDETWSELGRGKHRKLPPPVSSWVKDVPADLNALCSALLSPDPQQRPTPLEVLKALEASDEPLASWRPAMTSAEFVGRASELARLGALFDAGDRGELALGLIESESGLGKSALLDALSARAEGVGTIVLRARCRENETIAYSAVDGAIDALSARLNRVSSAECHALLPPGAGLLTVLFPVMASVQELSQLPHPKDVPRDPGQLREYCFGVLRQLLQRLSQRMRVVLVLDDLQWADEESLSLLDELLRAPKPPALCVLMGVRTLKETKPFTSAWSRFQEGAARVEHCVLQPLDERDARHLARRMLGKEHHHHVDRIARESAGHPLFIEVLSRQCARNLQSTGGIDEAVGALAQRLSTESQSLLSAVCVAARGTSTRVLSAATMLRGEQVHAASSELAARRLVRIHRGLTHDRLEPYHDRIRLAIVGTLEASERVRCHARLAEAIAAEPDVDHEALATHWHEAGDDERAAEAVLHAAKRAAQTLAFEKAATLYAWALILAPSHRDAKAIRHEHAQMWARAGKSSRAAAAFKDVVIDVQGHEAREVRAQIALQLIRAGCVNEGIAAAQVVTEEMGISLPSGQRAAIARMTWLWLRRRFKGEGRVLTEAAPLDPETCWRVDTLYALSSSLSPVSAHHGMVLHFQHVIEALDLGEPGRVARALAFDSLGLYYMGAKHKIPAQLARVQELAAKSTDSHIVALCRFGEGLAYALLGETRRAVALMLQSENELIRYGIDLGWVVTGIRTWRLLYTWRLGDFGAYIAEMPLVLRDARRSEEPYLRAQILAIQAPAYYLAIDQPERAAASLDEAAELVTRPSFGTQDWFALVAKLRLDAYTSDSQAAERFLARWPEVTSSSVVRVSYLASEAFLLHALTLLSLHGQDACAEALADAKRLEKKGHPAEALLVRAAVAQRRRNRKESLSALEEAEALLAKSEAFDMLSVVRYARGRLLGAGPGYPVRRAVCDELARAGIGKPARFLACQLPGLVDDATCDVP